MTEPTTADYPASLQELEQKHLDAVSNLRAAEREELSAHKAFAEAKIRAEKDRLNTLGIGKGDKVICTFDTEHGEVRWVRYFRGFRISHPAIYTLLSKRPASALEFYEHCTIHPYQGSPEAEDATKRYPLDGRKP